MLEITPIFYANVIDFELRIPSDRQRLPIVQIGNRSQVSLFKGLNRPG